MVSICICRGRKNTNRLPAAKHADLAAFKVASLICSDAAQGSLSNQAHGVSMDEKIQFLGNSFGQRTEPSTMPPDAPAAYAVGIRKTFVVNRIKG